MVKICRVGVMLIVALTAVGRCHAQQTKAPDQVRIVSWNGRIAAIVTLAPAATGPAALHFSATLDGHPVLLPAPMQLDLAGDVTLGADCRIFNSRAGKFQRLYQRFPGKRRNIDDRGNEAVISLIEKSGREWGVVIRAYDEGVAFRYNIPFEGDQDDLVIVRERSSFEPPANAIATALPLANFTTSHEGRYVTSPIAQLPREGLLAMPMLLELPRVGWIALTEADLYDYAGAYLTPVGDNPTRLETRLAPRRDEPEIAVRTRATNDSPWRVAFIGDHPGRFIESDMLTNLNKNGTVAPSWIKPGKTTFPWWNGYYEENVPFKPGLNTETAKYYIDFCAEAGIPYHSLDGVNDTAWYGGPIVPYEGADITQGLPGLDLQEVLRYGKSKGVRLRLWMHWQAAEKHMHRAFPLYRQWGVEGVMIDFMDRDDQQMNQFLRQLITLAAENQLTVTLHGVAKPTGLEQTFPNLLTSEGVLNLEYDKWDETGITPSHELTVPYTRMLAGPMDFHQGSLRTVAMSEFKPRNEAPLVIGTPCRTLASYVVFLNHLPMVADYPSAYRGHPALATLAAIPATWDDTKFVDGAVGKFIVVARQSGRDWWIGAMTNETARQVSIPLDFLGEGKFEAHVFVDDLAAEHKLSTKTERCDSTTFLRERLAPAGGLLVRLVAADPDAEP